MLSPSGVHVSTRKVKWLLAVIISVLFSPFFSASRFTAGAFRFLNLSQLRSPCERRLLAQVDVGGLAPAHLRLGEPNRGRDVAGNRLVISDFATS
jgi:hypothetical protein